jgi:hypothetical protein
MQRSFRKSNIVIIVRYILRSKTEFYIDDKLKYTRLLFAIGKQLIINSSPIIVVHSSKTLYWQAFQLQTSRSFAGKDFGKSSFIKLLSMTLGDIG